MKMDVVAKDCSIVCQLAGIRTLERELTDAALTVRASSPRRPRLRGGRSLTLPVYGSNIRLPPA
jgi:hypothetical protein